MMKRNTDDFISLFRSLQADDLQGARLRGGRRLRHRAVLRPGRHGRGRAHRLHAGARVGLPDHGDVGLPARRREGEAHAAHRRHDRRPRGRAWAWCSRRSRPPSSTPRWRAGRPHGRRADQPAGDAEADDQPGLRQHGPARHADARHPVRRHRHSPKGRWFQQLAADEASMPPSSRDSGRWIPEGGTTKPTPGRR